MTGIKGSTKGRAGQSMETINAQCHNASVGKESLVKRQENEVYLFLWNKGVSLIQS